MTYKEWAKEYSESAGIIKEKLEALKTELKTASPEELKDLEFRISVLYGMYLDCTKTAELLEKRKGSI